jgi:hypothetical protein
MSDFQRLLEIILPSGGYLSLMMEAYFDESGTHDGSPVLCVGGFVIDSSSARELDQKWGEMLLQYGLPFFHMTDCAGGYPPFDQLSKQGCIDVATDAIQLIRKLISGGIMTSIYPSDFKDYAPDHEWIGSAYSFCVHICLTGVQNWANRRGCVDDFAYIFEAGHASQSESNRIMNKIFSSPQLRQRQRYVSHTFADKMKVKLLQAADLITWHWYTENKRKLEGVRRNMRKDTTALMSFTESGADFTALHCTPETIKLTTKSAFADLYPLTYPGVL